MSCIFCNSFYHFSEFCDIYVSNECRKEYLRSKNYCENCLKHVNNLQCGKNCTPKCYICFSKSHPTVFCSIRDTAEKLFLPNIDYALLQRFCKIFDFHSFEQLILSFYLPKRPQLFHPKSIKVQYIENFKNTFFEHKETKIVIAKKVHLNFLHLIELSKNLSNLHFKAETVLLYGSKIPAWMLLKLLSSSTKIFKSINVELTTKLEFAEILVKLPNIEEIFFSETNIKIDNLWVEELMANKAGRNLKNLSLELDENSCNFNVEALATFMKTKSMENVQIRLHLFENNISTLLKDNLMKYFNSLHQVPGKLPLLFLQITKGVTTKIEAFTLKKDQTDSKGEHAHGYPPPSQDFLKFL